MPMTINTNVVSLNAQRNLNMSQSSLATSMQRLSSGLRVNSARTTPPAWPLPPPERTDPRHQRRHPQRQRRHLAGADGRRRAGHDHRCAAAHARAGGAGANGSNGTGDRANLDTEYQELSAEITRIAAQTKFNGTAIVGPSAGAQVFQVGANSGDTLTITTTTVTTVAGDLTTAASRLHGAGRDRYGAGHGQHQPRQLRCRDEPLLDGHPEPADRRREPVGGARPHHGRRLRGGDGQPVAQRRSCSRPAARWWRRPTSCPTRCWHCCADRHTPGPRGLHSSRPSGRLFCVRRVRIGGQCPSFRCTRACAAAENAACRPHFARPEMPGAKRRKALGSRRSVLTCRRRSTPTSRR